MDTIYITKSRIHSGIKDLKDRVQFLVWYTFSKSINLAIPQNSGNSKFIVLHLNFQFHRRKENLSQNIFRLQSNLEQLQTLTINQIQEKNSYFTII